MFGRALCGLGLAGALLAPQVANPPDACAAAGPRAALVIDRGPVTERYCVMLDSEAISGVHLIELAARQHGLDYQLGYGGQAVCMLAGVGPTGGDCFAEDPLFWGYFRADSNGEWSWSSVGAGSTVVEDGDVEGWSWGSGQGAADHSAPPVTPLYEVCAPSPSPSSSFEPSASPRPSPSPTADSAPSPEPYSSPAPSPQPSPPAPEKPSRGAHDIGRASRQQRLPERERGRVHTTVAAPVQKQGPRRADESNEGPPVAGLAGLAGAVVAGALGSALGRRRGATERTSRGATERTSRGATERTSRGATERTSRKQR